MLSKRFGGFLSLFVLLSLCRLAAAHPMGNFSVNHYSKIVLDTDRIRIRYFIDLAEIPTFQEMQQANISATAIDPNSTAVISYIAVRGAELGRGLSLVVDGNPAALHLISSEVIFPPGAGGLPTMKMGFVYEAAFAPTPSRMNRQHVTLSYADHNYPGHTGWKEIVALASAGSLLRSSVPATDRSGELSNYPTDLLTSPPQDLDASLIVSLPTLPTSSVADAQPALSSRIAKVPAARALPGLNPSKREVGTAPSQHATPLFAKTVDTPQPSRTAQTTMHLQANRQQTPRSKFTELIQAQHLSVWFLFTAAVIAIGLGGLHALEPGHGKTIVAAYLVGSRGTARHAVLLGIIVTVSHTAGVFALGAITLYASRYIVPEQLYPWLGVFSGITIAGLGCYMFLRRLTGTATDHSHAPGTSQGHLMFWKRPKNNEALGIPVQSNTGLAQSVGLTQLLALGITGGIVPCPAALIVLLSAFALHRIGLGFFLIVAFSVGLAAVLIDRKSHV